MICQKNVAARVRGLIFLYIYIENFKIKIFVRNHWTDFIITWQKCFLVDPHDSSKNLAARGRGLFSLCIYIEKI